MSSHSSCKLMFLIPICLTLIGTSNAQDTQRVEIFGGYSLLHDKVMLSPTTNFNGWDGSGTVFVNRWFGLTGDVSGHYGSETQVVPAPPGGTAGKIKLSASRYTFMGGPHFTYHKSRYAPFAQALFGGYHELFNQTTLIPVTCSPPLTCVGPSGGGTGSSGFAMALGGGLDIDIGHGISFRPVQAEYLLQRNSTVISNKGTLFNYVFYNNAFRYSTGIVFHFGPHLGT